MQTEETIQPSRWLRSALMAIVVAAVTLGVVWAFPRARTEQPSGCGPDGCSHETQAAATTAAVPSNPPETADAALACPVTGATMASLVCPVMGTTIPSVEKAVGKSTYQGKTYYFCCAGCKPQFDKDPAKYVQKT